MKITRKPLGENLERFEMTLERSDWYGEYDKQLRQARREMAVPGFRRGQAPLGLVARRLGGEEWMYQFVNQAQQRELNRYVDAEGRDRGAQICTPQEAAVGSGGGGGIGFAVGRVRGEDSGGEQEYAGS